MEVDFNIIDKNLDECWSFYKDYLNECKKKYFSDYKAADFIVWCEEELWLCPNCHEVVVKDDQGKLWNDSNTDHVCDACIEELGYYE